MIESSFMDQFALQVDGRAFRILEGDFETLATKYRHTVETPASSQSIDSKGDIRTSAKQKDEHAKESAKDPPLTASSLVLFTFIPVSAYGNSHRSLVVLKLRSGDWLLDQFRLTEMKTTIDSLHVNAKEASLQGTRSP